MKIKLSSNLLSGGEQSQLKVIRGVSVHGSYTIWNKLQNGTNWYTTVVWIDSHCENLIGGARTVQLKLAISSGMGGMSAKHQPGPLAPGNTPAPENTCTREHSCTKSTMDTGQTSTTCTRSSQRQPHHHLHRRGPLCSMTSDST